MGNKPRREQSKPARKQKEGWSSNNDDQSDRASRIVQKVTWFAIVAVILLVTIIVGFFAVMTLSGADVQAMPVSLMATT